jgi:hypothetical protein
MALKIARELAFYRGANAFIKIAGNDIDRGDVYRNYAIELRQYFPNQCLRYSPAAIVRVYKQPCDDSTTASAKTNNPIGHFHYQNVQFGEERLHVPSTSSEEISAASTKPCSSSGFDKS